MKLEHIYSENSLAISLEVFPPKEDFNGDKTACLINHLNVLKKHNPHFISLTYGAAGTANDKSYDLLETLISKLESIVMPHFTCVNASRQNVKGYLDDIMGLGVQNILALRGDIPEGYNRENFDFKYASDLISFIKNNTQNHFSIAVAGYPEGHIESDNIEEDFKFLKQKVQMGADAVFTQMFFDNDKYFRFADKVHDFMPNLPVVAGIMPIISYKQIDKMLSMAKVSLPKKLENDLEKFKDNSSDIKKIGIEFTSTQCQKLIEGGVKGLHFYTLNLSSATDTILTNLNC